MHKFTNLIRPFKPANFTLYVATLGVIGITLVLLFIKKTLPPFLPLWYSRPWGQLRLASPSALYIVPALSFGFLIINHYLANLFRKNNLALSQILVWSTLVIALIGLVAIYKILLLV